MRCSPAWSLKVLMLELVDSYTWPNDGTPFAGLGLRMDDLASRLGVAVHTWDVGVDVLTTVEHSVGHVREESGRTDGSSFLCGRPTEFPCIPWRA